MIGTDKGRHLLRRSESRSRLRTGRFQARPIIQNDIGNKYSPTVIISAITSQIQRLVFLLHWSSARSSGLEKDSVILLEQVRTIDKRRLKRRVARLDDEIMEKVDEALAISVGLKPV